MLRDDQWERFEPLLLGKASDPGCTARDNRRFVEAVLWIMRTGSHWRDLPTELGTYVSFSHAGASRVSGSVWPRQYAVMPIWSICSSTPPLFVPTSILRVPKKRTVKRSAASEAGWRPNCMQLSTHWAIRCGSFSRLDRSPKLRRPLR